jgi:hypothetical protein|tara:strand:+ start:69 stop:791 length:723 start_codon:yes stop_codon:yes gene_type:complete
MKRINCFIILLILSSSPIKGQFLEPGISLGLNSYSGDLNRGYSPFPGSFGYEIFNRFNMSSHQSYKISYKRGLIAGKDNINDALSKNRDMWFKSKFSEISAKIEYNFLDYFDEISRENFTPYLFFGVGSTFIKNTNERNTKLNNKNKMIISIPFGTGIKYLIKNTFSIALEFEIKKTFYDEIDIISGPSTTSSTLSNLSKNYQYGNLNDKDFYYFTGISISYIFYKIPCPRDSAPKNSIY